MIWNSHVQIWVAWLWKWHVWWIVLIEIWFWSFLVLCQTFRIVCLFLCWVFSFVFRDFRWIRLFDHSRIWRIQIYLEQLFLNSKLILSVDQLFRFRVCSDVQESIEYAFERFVFFQLFSQFHLQGNELIFLCVESTFDYRWRSRCDLNFSVFSSFCCFFNCI
jgi:hypothetical protein